MTLIVSWSRGGCGTVTADGAGTATRCLDWMVGTRSNHLRGRSPRARAGGAWTERAGAVALVGAAALGLASGHAAVAPVVAFVVWSQCAIVLAARAGAGLPRSLEGGLVGALALLGLSVPVAVGSGMPVPAGAVAVAAGLLVTVGAAARGRLPRMALIGWIGRQWDALLPAAGLAAGQGLLVAAAAGAAGRGAWGSLAVFVAYLFLAVVAGEALLARIGKAVWAGAAPPSVAAIRRVVLEHGALFAVSVVPLLVGWAAAGVGGLAGGDPGAAGGGAAELGGLGGVGLGGVGLGAAVGFALLAVASALAGVARSLGDDGRAPVAFLVAGVAVAAGLPVAAVAGVLAALMLVLLLVLASNVPRVGVHVL